MISSTASSADLAQSTSAQGSPSTSTVDNTVNVVGGGVVGGLLGLFILCSLLYGYFQWKRGLSRNEGSPSLRIDTEHPASGEVEESSMTQVRVTNFAPPRSAVPSFVSPNLKVLRPS